MGLFVASDAIHGARVGVKDLVVARPEFVGKVGTDRNQAMEVDVIAKRPRKAAKQDDGENGCAEFEFEGWCGGVAEEDPGEEERQDSTERRVGEQGKSPKQAVDGVCAEIADFR